MRKGPIRVLVVDDNENDFIYIRLLLNKNSPTEYKVSWASSFEAAQVQLMTQTYDVGLVDYRLGEKSGLDLLHETNRSFFPPLILLTGAESVEIDRQASEAGAADYLCKATLDAAHLERSIRYSIRHAHTLQALRESQNRLELFMKHVPCAIGIKDKGGRYVYINPTFEHLLNRNSQEWIGKLDKEIWPEIAEQLEEHDRTVLDSQCPAQAIEVLPKMDGKRYWLASRFPMINEEGSPLLGIAAVDITQRVQAEEKLIETTELLTGLLSNLPVLIVRISTEGIVEEARGHALGRLDIKEEEWVGVNLFKLYPSLSDPIRKSLQGCSTNFVWSLKHNNQTSFFDTYFFFDHNRGKGAIGFGIDITERVQAEESVKQKSQMLNGLLDHLPVIVGRLDKRGMISEIQGTPLKEYDIKNLLGKNVTQIEPRIRDYVEQALQGQSVSFPLKGTHKKEPWYFDNHLFFDTERKEGAIFFSFDVTERKLLEKKLLEIRDDEQQRIGRDLHDGLGQVLTGVACLSTALRDKLQSTAKPEANEAATIAELVSKAIAQVRSLARGLCPVQLEGNGLQSALEELAYTIEQVHKIECWVQADASTEIYVHSVALNLFRIAQEAINNAIKHAKANKIVIQLTTSEKQNVLSIKDNGKGFIINKKETPGMGLQMMHYRAGMVGGVLKISSKINKGTLIECSFQNLLGQFEI